MPTRKVITMTDSTMNLLKTWPLFAAIGGFVLTWLYTVRYKLPELTKRLDSHEERLKCVEVKHIEAPDLDRAIDSFHTISKFNQVSSQLESQTQTAKIGVELNKSLTVIHEKINKLAISNAKVVSTMQFLVKENEKNGGKKND